MTIIRRSSPPRLALPNDLALHYCEGSKVVRQDVSSAAGFDEPPTDSPHPRLHGPRLRACQQPMQQPSTAPLRGIGCLLTDDATGRTKKLWLEWAGWVKAGGSVV
jgi:hypothetical protein